MSSAEVKLRTLATADTTMQAIFGDGVDPDSLRWFDTQLPQDQEYPSVVVRRVSTVINYTNDGLGQEISEPRFQFDIRHPQYDAARTFAAAVIDFLNTVDLTIPGGGAVKPAAAQAPTFVLNQRSGLDYELTPPVGVQTLDVRLFNLEE